MSDIQEEIKEILQSILFRLYCDSPISKKYGLELDKNECKLLLDYITNLQKENEYSNYCNEELRKKITNLEYKIERLEEDNKQLKDLCDKYEEEHNTTFEEWKKDIKANKKAVEYIETIRNNTPSTPRKDIARMILLREDMLLNILQGSDKE